MFTGLVEEIGRVRAIEKSQKFSRLTIQCSTILSDLKMGDSVCTNGVCLTATHVGKDSYQADVMGQTLRISGLGNLKVGDWVNLERAMGSEGRFGGHMVTGHVDGIGKIEKIERESEALWLTVSVKRHILELIIDKGSIAIDGVSLTVAEFSESTFKVSLIPHTAKATTLGSKKVGDLVNLENDLIGKYIARLMNHTSKGGSTCLSLAALEAFLKD